MQELVEKKLRFELRARPSELDFANSLAKIEPLALFGRLAKQPLQPPPKIRGLADVRLAVATQQEHCRRSRNLCEETLVAIRRECQYMRDHKDIVISLTRGTGWYQGTLSVFLAARSSRSSSSRFFKYS